MRSDDVLILRGDEVDALLTGCEQEVMQAVERAYVAHSRGFSSLPHSTFLRFPNDDLNRIIALPAYLGDGFDLAGMKWVASFPGNVKQGMARASAVLILNDAHTGFAQAILESSLINARRTAASAALAARLLRQGQETETAGLIGTGVINDETARYLAAALPGLRRFVLFDLDRERAESLAGRLRQRFGEGKTIEVATAVETLYRESQVVAFATTAIKPHVSDLSACPKGATILHTSLRDLEPQLILANDNIVDDADHVSRANTSIHLAEQLTGNRDFIRGTIADLAQGTAPAKRDPEALSIVSPVGLGVLDLAVGQLARERAEAQGVGTRISGFLPTA
ncbi:MAG TPA: 2,3-diaminopropionate biosynthesis protein SbnB [Thermoanaerobaculia bacterium]